jgi:hypothetical protein
MFRTLGLPSSLLCGQLLGASGIVLSGLFGTSLGFGYAA